MSKSTLASAAETAPTAEATEPTSDQHRGGAARTRHARFRSRKRLRTLLAPALVAATVALGISAVAVAPANAATSDGTLPAGTPVADYSDISAISGSGIPDGVTPIVVTVTIEGWNGTSYGPLTGQTVALTGVSGRLNVTPTQDLGNGNYNIGVTSTVPGSFDIGATVVINGVPTPVDGGTQTLTYTSPVGAAIPAYSTISSVSGPGTADGKTPVTVTVMIEGQGANGISTLANQTVALTGVPGSVKVAPTRYLGNGFYAIDLTTDIPQTFDVDATVVINGVVAPVGTEPSPQPVSFTVPAGTAVPAYSSISSVSGQGVADGKTPVTVTVTIEGWNGTSFGPLTGQTVALTGVPSNVKVAPTQDLGNGNYAISLTTTTAQTFNVGATVVANGVPVSVGTTPVTTPVTFTSAPSTGSSIISTVVSVISGLLNGILSIFKK